jgi:hypothetical protein
VANAIIFDLMRGQQPDDLDKLPAWISIFHLFVKNGDAALNSNAWATSIRIN